MLNLLNYIELPFSIDLVAWTREWEDFVRGEILLCCAIPLYSLLNTCFCLGISCKPQEATPARVSGSTVCPSNSTLHQGQSFHPYVTVYFYPYYKTRLESQKKQPPFFHWPRIRRQARDPKSLWRQYPETASHWEAGILGPNGGTDASGDVLGKLPLNLFCARIQSA